MVAVNESEIKVGLVQINNSFSGQNYLPLAVGFLQSYAETHLSNPGRYKFLSSIYKRTAVDAAVEHLSDADIVGFSNYVWNFELSKAIASKLKEKKPETLIVFGGCHIPEPNIFHRQYIPGQDEKLDSYIQSGGRPDFFTKGVVISGGGTEEQTHYNFYTIKDRGLTRFLRGNPYVDLASTGEGEIPFTSILENFPERNWTSVPALHYIGENGEVISTFPTPRIENLNEVPSPYLTGVFTNLMQENSEENWIALFETNRGCPFGCTFCDWGTNSKKRLANYDLEGRVFKEVDWISQNKVQFVYCCDANFGMFGTEHYGFRDLKIAQKFAANKKEHGFPHRFSVQNTKNSTESIYQIQKTLNDSGLDKGVLLAFQSLDNKTLEAIVRSNISLKTFFSLQTRFTEEGIATFSDIILGLPEETYETFTKGVSTLIEHGQHNRIQFNNHSILPNAPIADQIERFGLDIVETDIVNIHGSKDEWSDGIYERQKLVVGTKSMPREDWIRAYCFGRMTNFLHFNKLFQMPNIIANSRYGVSYKKIIDAFLAQRYEDTPILREANELFEQHARNIQGGSQEYIHSQKWLNIWWPADELAMINIVSGGKLDRFYNEAERTLGQLLIESGAKDHESIMREAIEFNRELIKKPFKNSNKVVKFSHNVLEIYRAGMVRKSIPVIKSDFSYEIDRTSDNWSSWEDWARRVIWWGNKKGDYIYSCTPIEEKVAVVV